MPHADTDSEFLLTSPDDIRAALFELNHPDSHIGVRAADDRDIAVELVAVDRKAPYFYWQPRDYAGRDFAAGDSRGLLSAPELRFVAQGYGGVLVRFAVSRSRLVRSDQGDPALASPFPEQMTRIQRRRSFRASAPGRMGATASWLPEGADTPLSMAVRDISIDGVGLRIEQPLTALPRPGAVLRKVRLELDGDELVADLEVRSTYALGIQDDPDQAGEPGADGQMPAAEPPAPRRTSALAKPLSHLGAAFTSLDKAQEIQLQRIVWRMEKARTER